MTKPVKKNYLSEGSEWTYNLLEVYFNEIERIAKDKFNLDTYPNQIEVITSEQMIDAYSSHAMPQMYQHWSYGKSFVSTMNQYSRGQMGLAYEVVINSSPCIAYLMEENTMMMQALVMAHASFGHNAFFKGNYLFRQWTDAEAIIDYLAFAKKYISECEEKYGYEEVEECIDSCHALQNYGVDRYKRPESLSAAEEKERQEEREAYIQSQLNDLWRTIPVTETDEKPEEEQRFPSEPQENILYFVEKNSPHLEPWKREIIRIVRKISQYFYPQRQTKLMNEGYATFTHYNIINEMYDEGLVDDGFMLEFFDSHSGVTFQPTYNHPAYPHMGINVYALGFAMFQDIKRVSMEPTEEDLEWFKGQEWVGNGDWIKNTDWAMRNFKDESFVQQFLSPKIIRDFGFFSLLDDDTDDEMEVSAIHDKQGYREIRRVLANQYNMSQHEPNLQVYDVDLRGDRSLTLRHYIHNGRSLEEKGTSEVLKHLLRLWGFDIKLESVDETGKVTARWLVGKDNKNLLDVFV
jgi:stage V sporulation protein R